MAGVIGVAVVESDEVRALRWRQLEPRDDLVDALFVVEGVVEVDVLVGPFAGDLGLGAGPEEGGGAHSVLLGQRPERSAAVPASVAICLVVFVGITLASGGVVEGVAHDAVVLGIAAGDEGEVIGKGDGGVCGKHSFRRCCSGAC